MNLTAPAGAGFIGRGFGRHGSGAAQSSGSTRARSAPFARPTLIHLLTPDALVLRIGAGGGGGAAVGTPPLMDVVARGGVGR